MPNTLPAKQEHILQADNLLLSIFIDVPAIQENAHLLSALHTHSHAELFACKSGKIQIESTEQIFSLFPGDVAIIPAEILHIGTTDASSISEWTNLGFACLKCASKTNRNLYKKIRPLGEQKNILIYKNESALYDIVKNLNTTENIEDHPALILDFLSELCKLSEAFASTENNTLQNKTHKNMSFDRLVKLDYFINEKFMTPLTNQMIADELHLSERQLSRLVMKHYGTSLHTILNKKRVSVAAHLLNKSSDTIESIALSVGFSNKTGFYREFKKVYGITPAEYRKSCHTHDFTR